MCIATFNFRYENPETAHKHLNIGNFIFTFDLKSAYHHVLLHEEHRKFLGFKFNNKIYEFCVLPFGISCTSFIFTKICKVLVNKWRAAGQKVFLYLDDGLCITDTYLQGIELANIIKSDLGAAGF